MRMMTRRDILRSAASVAAAAWAAQTRAGADAKTSIAVYKDPNCGCCHKWVEHMTANGFAASVTNTTSSCSDFDLSSASVMSKVKGS